jgi:hypothetical protein
MLLSVDYIEEALSMQLFGNKVAGACCKWSTMDFHKTQYRVYRVETGHIIK